jgi:hypothetical protein
MTATNNKQSMFVKMGRFTWKSYINIYELVFRVFWNIQTAIDSIGSLRQFCVRVRKGGVLSASMTVHFNSMFPCETSSDKDITDSKIRRKVLHELASIITILKISKQKLESHERSI